MPLRDVAGDIRGVLGGLIGQTIVDVTTDDWEDVLATFGDVEDDADMVSFVYLHLADGSTLAFACNGPAVFSYPAEPSETLSGFREVFELVDDDGEDDGEDGGEDDDEDDVDELDDRPDVDLGDPDADLDAGDAR